MPDTYLEEMLETIRVQQSRIAAMIENDNSNYEVEERLLKISEEQDKILEVLELDRNDSSEVV